MSRANNYEKNPPPYQIFDHNCDDAAIEMIGNLGTEVDMIKTLPNNSFYVRTQAWEDWNFAAIGKNSIRENILDMPGGYYVWKGYMEKE